MRKIHIILAVAALLSSSYALADDQDMSSSKPCRTIAQACLDAGYTRDSTSGKRFWQDCMKPVVLGNTVQSVTIDAATVKSCRTDKIAELKQELKEFQEKNKS